MIAFTLLFFCLNFNAKAQKIDLADYKNKAQAYAILSAQYSKDAYMYSRQNVFSHSIKRIKQNCDTALVCVQIAIEYGDSACSMADTSFDNRLAVAIIKKTKAYQKKAIQEFEKIRREIHLEAINDASEVTLFATSNSVAEAYKASLYFKGSKSKSKETERDITRLESDEFSFNTVKEIYANKLVQIDSEKQLLENELKNSSGNTKIEIEEKITALNKEEKRLTSKLENSEEKLIDIKTELSEEMLTVIDKGVFTTEKDDFYDEKVPIPNSPKVQKGLVYKVQIGFFKKRLPDDHFDGIFPVASEKIDDTHYRYLAGNFAKYEEAKEARVTIFNKGYHDSFVVAYVDGEKIPVYKALKIEKAK